MDTRLLFATAASGKTHACIEQVRVTLQRYPLAPTWVVLPSWNQVLAFRRRLAAHGGALGARIGTFSEFYAALLAEAGKLLPVAPDPVLYRLALTAIDTVSASGQLEHYGPIQHKPGFVRALTKLIAELKRARIDPREFSRAVQGMGRRLEELARLYQEYQEALVRLKWADGEGLGWLAVQALTSDDTIGRARLIIVDGFDSFTPTQLEVLELLSGRLDELVVTLSGEPDMPRRAYRRFQRTLGGIRAALHPEEMVLSPYPNPITPFAHLERSLFETRPDRVECAGRVWFTKVQTTALEAREALRWIKARIVRDGVRPDQCAILAYDLAPYRPFLREAGHEFGMPLRIAGGEPLLSNPAIAAILNLLELSVQGWPRRPLLDALRTPYLALTRLGFAAADATRFKRVAYWGHVIAGLDQWEDVFTRLETRAERVQDVEAEESAAPDLPLGAGARALWEHLKALATRVTPPERATLLTFVEWLEELLDTGSGLAVAERIAEQKDTVDRDQTALAEFRDILRSLVLSERTVGERGELLWTDFLQELRGALQAASYVPDDIRPTTDGSIYVAQLGAARGVSYRAVAFLGLSEGLFPAPLDEDPFLSDDERALLVARGLALEPRLRSDQQTLFYEAVTRASEYLLLSRPYLADDGERWKESPFWTEALSLFDCRVSCIRAEDDRHHSEAASVIELLTDSVRRRALPKRYAHLETEWAQLRHGARVLKTRLARAPEGPFEGQLDALAQDLANRFSEQHVWSASRIEAYAACPFRFLVAAGLELEPSETPKAGFDAAQLGGMLHAILENVYQQSPDPTDIESVLRVLPQVAGLVFDRAPLELGFRLTPLWDAERAELIQRLENTLRSLAAEANGFQPHQFEVRFGFEGSPPLVVDTAAGTLRFHGVIDRVDGNGRGAARIIDYKTGMSHLDVRALQEGKRMQLALYALAAEQVLDLGRVVDGFYWGILKGEAGSLRLEKFRHTSEDGREFTGMRGAIDLTKEYLAKDIQAIRSGSLSPVPPRDGCPHYCEAKTICWRYQPSEF